MELKLRMFGPRGLINNFVHTKQWRVAQDGWNFDGILFGRMKQEKCLVQPANETADKLIKVDIISEEGRMWIAGFGNRSILEAAKLGIELNWRRLRHDPDSNDIPYDIKLTVY